MLNYTDDSILRWIEKYSIKNSKGNKFEWRDHLFLIDPLCDWSPNQAMVKSSQIGASESIGILKALFAAKHNKLNVIYTLPSDKFLQKFVPPKVDRIIENNPLALSNIEGGVTLKKVGQGLDQRFIYFMGSHNTSSELEKEESGVGVSVSSDLNIHDESSKSDQFVLNQLTSRLDDSDYKGRWLFDNPTYPLMGADAIYQKSDQKHWIIQCSRCGYRQYLDWIRLDKIKFESGTNHSWVDPDMRQFVCGKCQRVLSDEDRRVGEWIAKFPENKDYRGYWMPQMIYIKHTASELLLKEENQSTHKSIFYNFVLGKPYIGSEVKIQRKDIIKNLDGNENLKLNNAIGVDQGVKKWYVIGNEQGIFAVGSTESWEEIEFLIKKYDCTFVGDALPYQRYPKKICADRKGKAWRAFYKPEADQTEVAKYGTKSDSSVILIKREEMFDNLVDKIMDGRYPIQVPIDQLDTFSKHWESLVRIVEPDRHGNERFKWHSVTGEDHLAHATVYFEAALMKARVKRAFSQPFPKKKKEEKSFLVSHGKMPNIYGLN